VAAAAPAPDREPARLRQGVAWNLVPVVLLGVVGLGLSFAIARGWGAAAYATWNLVTVVYFAFAVVGAGGLQYAVLRAVAAQAPDPTAADRARVAPVVVGALVPGVALAALATAAFLAARPLFARWLASPDVGVGMAWAAPGLFCFAVNKLLFGVVNGLRRMRAFAVYTSLRYMLIAAGLAAAYATRLPAARLAAIWTFTELPLLAILSCELCATVPVWRARGWTAWLGPHLAYGARGVVATLAFELNTKLDVWMLGLLVADKAAIGVYALAAALNDGVMQLPAVVQANVDPLLARSLAGADRGELAALVARIRRWFVPAIAAVCAAAAIGFPLVIPWLAGDRAFVAGAAPFAILVAGQALASPWTPFAHLLLMAKLPGWHTVLLVVAIAANALAARALIPLLGTSGAAIAAAGTTVLAAVVLRGLARRHASAAI
jgi:O-antigen/teichoic acid export membrane protein